MSYKRRHGRGRRHGFKKKSYGRRRHGGHKVSRNYYVARGGIRL